MQRTSSCNWVRSLAEMFASQGADVPSVFAIAGVDAARLQSDEERFGVDEVSRLWHAAVKSTGNPVLGVDRSVAARYGNFDVVGYAMLSSQDLRSGLQALARFMAIVSDAATFELVPDPQANAWLVLGGSGYTLPVPRQRYGYGYLALLALCQWLTRAEVQPLVVDFKFDAPPEAERYRSEFACEVRFAQPENRMLFGAHDLDRGLPTRNPAMLGIHEELMRVRLEHLGAGTTSHRVTEEIIRRLHRGEPRREQVAASLALADRTLRRRLEAEHTSFQHLLEDARRELAHKYLADGRYTLHQITDLLGFVNHGNFFRACQRWMGEPPGEHRRRIVAGQEA